ncbi:MAG: dehydratase [Blastococcus sp.]|nr:dehydratase [Blastococcus sp.]
MKVFRSLAELAAAEGQDLGHSDWLTVGQDRVQWFADATGDDHWIHLDPDRARAAGYPGTLVHGFLTLALIADFMQAIYRVDDVELVLNYGLDRVRFPAPVPTGSRLRGKAALVAVSPTDAGAKVTVRYEIEADGIAKPVCVADHHTMQFTTA